MEKYIIIQTKVDEENGKSIVSLSHAACSLMIGYIAQSREDKNVKQRFVNSRRIYTLPNYFMPRKSMTKLVNKAFQELQAAGLVRFDREMRRIWLNNSPAIWSLTDKKEDCESEDVIGIETEYIKYRLGNHCLDFKK